jgi:benzoate-CoA ligase family protein
MTVWPEHLNIDRLFLRDRVDEGNGSRVALRLDDGDLTFAGVDALASSYAAALFDLEVSRSDRVLVVMPDGADYVGALFGILRVGAVAVMLNPGLTTEAMAAIVAQSRAWAVVVWHGHLDDYRAAVAIAGHTPAELVVTGDPMPEAAVDPVDTLAGDPALWLFSGGTTGLPKAVVQSHRSFANTTELYGKGSLGMTAADITIAVPKLYFGYATGSNLFFPFSVGASSVLFDSPPTPAALFERIQRHRATVLINVPSAINQMLNDPGAQDADLSSLRLATSAGEALPETLYDQWRERFGVELLDGLGTAEMWHIFITSTVDDVKPGTLGRVVPGFEIKACDEDGVEVPPGEVGRLWVRGDSLAIEYWDNPELTAASFVDGWFVGGDLVSIDEDGYVTHRGRADDAIKVKGKWFRPQEVESVLLDHDAVKEAAVVAVTDDAGLAKPVAFVVSAHPVEERELIDWVLSKLEPYKHPRRVFLVESLPQTHLGKTDRAALKAMAGPGIA